MSGSRTDRPGLAALLDYARDRDTVVVWRLDRLRGLRVGSGVVGAFGAVVETAAGGVESGILSVPAPVAVALRNVADAVAQLGVAVLDAELERLGGALRRRVLALSAAAPRAMHGSSL